MLDGSRPQVRRVLSGQDAHESLLSFFYLAEVLTLSEIVESIPRLERSTDRPTGIRRRFEHLKSATKDPHHQLGDELLQVFVPTVNFFKSIGPDRTELCELGCTFFSAVEKVKICSSLLDAGLDMSRFLCAAVEHSDYFLRGALKLHQADRIAPYRDYSEWKPSTQHPFHLSRFVASYAMTSTDEFASWLRHFSAFHIIDVINLESSDFTTSNNGLRQIFFDFPKLVASFRKAGWAVYLNQITPDFNSGRECAVVKMFGIREDVERSVKVSESVRAHTDLADILPMQSLEEESARAILERTRTSLSREEWEAMAAYKKHFPIWGRTESIRTLADVSRVTSRPKAKVNLRFESGQINYMVKHALGEPL